MTYHAMFLGGPFIRFACQFILMPTLSHLRAAFSVESTKLVFFCMDMGLPHFWHLCCAGGSYDYC